MKAHLTLQHCQECGVDFAPRRLVSSGCSHEGATRVMSSMPREDLEHLLEAMVETLEIENPDAFTKVMDDFEEIQRMTCSLIEDLEGEWELDVHSGKYYSFGTMVFETLHGGFEDRKTRVTVAWSVPKSDDGSSHGGYSDEENDLIQWDSYHTLSGSFNLEFNSSGVPRYPFILYSALETSVSNISTLFTVLTVR